MKHDTSKNKLNIQENIETKLNNLIKKKCTAGKQKSSKYLNKKLKSETKIKQIYIKEMKIISNVFKNLTINEEKKSEDCEKSPDSHKYNKPSLYIKSPNIIIKKNTLENSATLDLINKLIEVNNESFLKNGDTSNKNSIEKKGSSSPITNLKLLSLSKNRSFSKMNTKKRNNILNSVNKEINKEEKPPSKSNNSKKRTSKKSFNEFKNNEKKTLSPPTIYKNKKSDKFLLQDSEKKIINNSINNSKRNSLKSNDTKKSLKKNSYFKSQKNFQRYSRGGTPTAQFDRDEDKHFSSISDKGRNLLRNSMLRGLSTISDNKNNIKQSTIYGSGFKDIDKINEIKSGRKNEVNFSKFSNVKNESTNSILGVDIDKLKQEIYNYENTDITDAINRLPTRKFDNNNDNNLNNILDNNKNKDSLINDIKSIEKKKSKTIRKLNRIITLNKERHRRLQRRKYIYDSLDDEENDDLEEKNFYFEPDCIFIYIIDFIICFNSFVQLLYFPIYLAKSFFHVGFLAKDILFYFNDVIFILDMIIGFFKAYYNYDEYLIIKSSEIIKNYVKNWFILDFICCIPFYSILKFFKKKTLIINWYDQSYFDYKGRNLYYLFILIKTFKIFKVISCNIFFKLFINKLKTNNFINDWGNVLTYIFFFISILNFGSCINIFVARNSYPNWISDLNINITDFFYIYICSIHHFMTTMTTIGYGDIVAKSMKEKIFEIFSLIVGTCLYSWIITEASNYIKKMNEKYMKFENNKKILDEIRVNYPLMTENLYDRVYRLLYYEKTHEEVDKNIILESLPYSIKNELLIKMYDPIINNFKIFRCFDNSEFIIRFVSLLKPMVCSKGDILVNEGDFIEDIILNKSGILSLDICIDQNKQKKSIEEYLKKYNLGKTKKKNPINQDQSKINISSYNTKLSISKENLSQLNSISYISTNDGRFVYSKTKKSKNIKFINVLYIRKKEYFGDVLMFLNEKSPLCIRVHSPKAELFLLRKTDVVNLSSDFPDIWKKMNEKSIFNYEQIKNIITKKLTNFCNYYGIKTKLLLIKKDTKNCLYSCPSYLMPIPDSIEDDSKSQSTVISKSPNSENISGENFYSNNNTSIIKEESNEESNINLINKKTFKNKNKNMENNNRNSKFFSAFSKQIQKIGYSSSLNKKNDSLENNNFSHSNITIISNSDNFNSPIWNKKILNPLSSSIINNNSNKNVFSLFMQKRRIKTKCSDHYIKNSNNKSINATCSILSENNNKSYEKIKSLKFDSDNENDEISSNEKYEIIFQEDDEELISKNNKNTNNNLSTILLGYNFLKNQKKNSNKFNNLKISTSSNILIKSSYENLNVFSNYRYIIDENLRKKTKHFIGVECGFVSQFSFTNSKFGDRTYRRGEIKNSKKFLRTFKTKKSLDSSRISRNYKCLSSRKLDDVSLSIHPNESIYSKKSRNYSTIRKAESFYMEKKIAPLKQSSSIKSKNYSRKSNLKNSISGVSEDIPKKKNKRRNGISSEIFVKQNTRRKMNLITENMEKDRQKLNNPNEFYADLFSNFVVNNRQINGSGISNLLMIRTSRFDEES